MKPQQILLIFVLIILLLSGLLLYLNRPTIYVIPYLKGRLGNRTFQVFAAKRYAELYGHKVAFCEKFIQHNPAEEDSMNDLRRIFPEIQTVADIGDYEHLDYSESAWEYKDLPYRSKTVLLEGYFQNARYIPKYLKDRPPIRKSPILKNTYFIHIRGGDYLSNAFHFVDLRKYYARSIKLIKKDDSNAEFLVFTDDNKYAKKIMKELDVSYRISSTITAYDSLEEMSSCSGAICANSSFSWLGSFFQYSRSHIYMPSKWHNDDKKVKDMYPPWAIVVSVE